MAKNRNKKTKNSNGKAPMDTNEEGTVSNIPQPQAMDTSESAAAAAVLSGSFPLKPKKGVHMKRSKNVRKVKAIAKAISKGEMASEKVHKLQSRKVRVQTAKSLYD